MKKILILASNPKEDLDLGYEIHALKNTIEESESLQEFDVQIDDAISPSNIQELFLKYEPRIVHFCGHGSGKNGLIFVDSFGKEQLVNTQALSNLFKEFDNTIECVLLNACYSKIQANEIAKHINYAIGMNQAITDRAAISFTKGFYQALGSGKKIEQCFKLGKNAIELELSKLSGQTRKFEVLDNEEYSPIPEHLKPTIKIKSELTLFPEDIARQKYIKDNQNDFDLGQRQQINLSKKEYRFRKILLNKVRDSWIKGVLENSLHTKALLELKIQGRPDLVHNPFSEYQELPVDPDSSYEWLHATDVFEQMGDGRTLLILGEPGSGKTIALLRLAKRFIEKADSNPSLPIPVVFNLSSWAAKRKPIAEWLVVELKEKYQVFKFKALAKQWIEQEQLLLLLDGLDEVKQEHRNDCVNAINNFLNSYQLTEIVICSRFQEYKSLAEQLKLRNALYIQPLTAEHIDWYLKDTGDQLSGLKTLLRNDTEIEDFAKTPLILNIMSLTYEGCSSEEVLKQLSLPENRYNNLFDAYVERMLNRRLIAKSKQNKNSSKYHKSKVKYWLTWLACTMTNELESIFMIEEMQPSLLKSKCEQRNYKISYFLIVGLSGGLIVKLGLSGGIIARLGLSGGIIPWLFVGLFVGLFAGQITMLIYTSSVITPLEQMSWSWQKVKSELSEGLSGTIITGLIVGLIFALILTSSWNLGLSEGLSTVLNAGLTVVFCILWLGLENIEKKQETSPNQGGIQRSANEAVVSGLINGLSIGLIMGLRIGLSYGLMSVLINGITYIKHFNLRRILYQKGFIPWKYARFLDYASDRLLMKKVGGGYIFYHRMLMEHFANMELEK